MSELLELEHSQKNWKVRPFANGRARPFANGRTFMGEPPWPQFQLDIFTRLGTVFLLIVTKSSVCNRQTLGPWSSVRTTVFCHQSRKYPKYRISNWTAGQIAHQPLELTILSTKVSKLIGHLYLFRRFLPAAKPTGLVEANSSSFFLLSSFFFLLRYFERRLKQCDICDSCDSLWLIWLNMTYITHYDSYDSLWLI